MCSYRKRLRPGTTPTSNRIMVSLLLPGPMEMDQWLKDVRASINMWPLQKTAHGVTNQMATEVFMRRERRRLQARHIWEKIEPDWPMIRARVWTKQATGLPYDALHRRLFFITTRKNPGGWRTPTGVRNGAGSNSSGRIVRHGLQVKPLRGPRVNGSVLCTSMGLISSTLCHGNGSINMRI